MRAYRLIDDEDIVNVKKYIVDCEVSDAKNKEIAYSAIGLTKEEIDIYGRKDGRIFTTASFKLNITLDRAIERIPDFKKRFRLDKDNLYRPNKRSKIGKEIDAALSKQESSWGSWWTVAEVLEMEDNFFIPEMGVKFQVPRFIDLQKEIILVCDNRLDMDKKRFEEVTITYVNEEIDKQ